MIVAAHQPHYMPWLGYIDKIARADVFVIMDDLQFETQNYQNRQRLKLSAGPSWLTVPVTRGSQVDPICAKTIISSNNPRHHWQHRHWNTLLINYGRAAYFAEYAEQLHEVYTRTWTSLVDLDRHMLALALRWFGVETPIRLASELGLTGTRTERILDLCLKLGARCYLTGSGGSTGYLDDDKLRKSGVDVSWQRFKHPTYTQRHPKLGFVSHLGFLDLVLNCGPACREILFGSPHRTSVAVLANVKEVA